MPSPEWQTLFDPQRVARPDTVRTELHIRLARTELPPDPATAFIKAQQTANNFEARMAGSGVVANNLAARLDCVRADALYVRVLFLFLGVPGVVLAILLTLGIAASSADRRRREQAILRVRGASLSQLLSLASAEGMATRTLGVVAGVGLSGLAAVSWWHLADLRLALPWLSLAAAIGFVLAVAAFLVPAWRDATRSTVLAARVNVAKQRTPPWKWLYLDLVLLAACMAVFWIVARSGYQLVLAPEGVAQTSVHYDAFPLCFSGLALVFSGSGWAASHSAEVRRLWQPASHRSRSLSRRSSPHHCRVNKRVWHEGSHWSPSRLPLRPPQRYSTRRTTPRRALTPN